MADTITASTPIENVRKTLVRIIAELESMNIEPPASLVLAALLLGDDDDRRAP